MRANHTDCHHELRRKGRNSVDTGQAMGEIADQGEPAHIRNCRLSGATAVLRAAQLPDPEAEQ